MRKNGTAVVTTLISCPFTESMALAESAAAKAVTLETIPFIQQRFKIGSVNRWSRNK
jgi:hypothetical protein